jgi:predicted nucleic acid-binding protein
MKIYLDVCCLNRPFDDLTQDRVNLEAESVLSILSRCEEGELTLYSSNIIDLEIDKNKDAEKLKKVRGLISSANEKLKLDDNATERATEFQKHGIKAMDSFHLAIAETNGLDVFLTTDDAFLRAAYRIKTQIVVANPVTWLMEVLEK